MFYHQPISHIPIYYSTHKINHNPPSPKKNEHKKEQRLHLPPRQGNLPLPRVRLLNQLQRLRTYALPLLQPNSMIISLALLPSFRMWRSRLVRFRGFRGSRDMGCFLRYTSRRLLAIGSLRNLKCISLISMGLLLRVSVSVQSRKCRAT